MRKVIRDALGVKGGGFFKPPPNNLFFGFLRTLHPRNNVRHATSLGQHILVAAFGQPERYKPDSVTRCKAGPRPQRLKIRFYIAASLAAKGSEHTAPHPHNIRYYLPSRVLCILWKRNRELWPITIGMFVTGPKWYSWRKTGYTFAYDRNAPNMHFQNVIDHKERSYIRSPGGRTIGDHGPSRVRSRDHPWLPVSAVIIKNPKVCI